VVTVALAFPDTGTLVAVTTPLAVTVSVTVEFSGTDPLNVHVKLSLGFASVYGNVIAEPPDVQEILVAVVVPEQPVPAMGPYTLSQMLLIVSLPALFAFVTVTVYVDVPPSLPVIEVGLAVLDTVKPPLIT